MSETVLAPNTKTGLNTVLRKLTYAPGDYILYGPLIYGPCDKTIAYVYARLQCIT